MEKVSVLIPAYNSENFIAECISSAMNQSYPNTEIIIADDGSTDNTFSICAQYARSDKRLKIVRKNNGARKGAGRKPTGKKTKCVFLTLTLEQAEKLYQDAEHADMTVSQYVVKRCLLRFLKNKRRFTNRGRRISGLKTNLIGKCQLQRR